MSSAEVDAGGAHRVVFTPSGRTGTVRDGTTVLDAARDLRVDLDTVCSGRGICGRCQVVPSLGSFPKWGIEVSEDHLGAPGPLETDYHGRRPLVEGRRLGCALTIHGDVVIDVPADSQIHRQIVRKGVVLDDIVVDPLIALHYVEVPDEPDDDQGRSALDRIRDALAADWGLTGLRPIFEVLGMLHPALQQADGALTVAVRDDMIIAAWPGFVDRMVGVAIDIGSTTIAGHLVDLATGEILSSAGRMNPQIRFGEDLMSRVSYAMMNPGGALALTAAVQFELDTLVTDLLDDVAIDRSQVLDLVLVGNPIMHHLVLGVDPSPLGQSPFTLATADAVVVRAPKLGITCPSAQVYVGPCIAGHVGADTAAAILAEGPHRGTAIQLLVDVGTNAEIVLGNRDGLYAASSPTGPAFEGAQISSGQRATTGAIERVRIDPDTLEPRFQVIGSELWSDEAGFTEAAELTGITGVCGSGIVEVIAELFLAGVIDSQGVIRGELAERTDRVVADERTFSYVLHRDDERELRVTQADVRAIQLAKAALRAGIELLLDHAGVPTVDEIRLAGAFGAHIDPRHAMVLGLIPDCPLDKVRAVGNAAGAGSVRALVSVSQRREMEEVVRTVTKIETATEPTFQERFIDALALPHRSASSHHLRQIVELPADAPVTTTAATPDGRRRRPRKEPT